MKSKGWIWGYCLMLQLYSAIADQSPRQGDMEALLEFQESLSHPFDDWREGHDYCKWYGVKCSPSGRVISLTIELELDYFPFYVRRNPLYKGKFAAPLARLDALRILTLKNVQFDGPVPDEWGLFPRLTTLILTDNNVTGSIPRQFGNITTLQRLQVERQGLNSVVPSELCKLSSLRWLMLNGAGLVGGLPHCLGDLRRLEVLMAVGNPNLVSTLPSTLGNLTLLKLLDLSDCGLVGHIPPLYGKLPQLQALSLNGNSLNGQIPESLGNISSLSTLDLANNELTGGIPSTLGNLMKLSSLSLASNRLKGVVPASLGNLSNMDWHILAKRGLSRSNLRPTERIRGISAINIDLSLNQLEGEIPATLGNLTPWSSLSLYNNKLMGSFPLSLLRLEEVYVDNNHLTNLGADKTAPQNSIVNILYLRSNRLRGPIPEWLRSLRDLARLDLSMNELSGDIPAWLRVGMLPSLQYLNLSHNHLNYNLSPTP
eukprot:Gb_35963 [translate_table: standard]